MQLPFNQITIIGVGHIGGSIGLALRKKGYNGKIIGVGRTKKNLSIAIKKGCIDEIDDENLTGTHSSDLIVLCTPIGSFYHWFNRLKLIVKHQAIITDAGSVKLSVVQEAKKAGIDDIFVPSHPVAGRETSGAVSADPAIFDDKVCIITPFAGINKQKVRRVEEFWKFLGCKIITMTPAQHDIVLGYTSHLPHVIAFTLMGVIGANLKPKKIIAGGALKDFTRIALSSPEMWRDIFLTNKNNLLKAIGDFKKELQKVEDYIRSSNSERMIDFILEANKYRKDLFKR